LFHSLLFVSLSRIRLLEDASIQLLIYIIINLILSSVLLRRLFWQIVTNVSDEPAVSIFRVTFGNDLANYTA
jgi:hypothetical protein